MVCERRWASGEFGVPAVGVPAGVAGFGAEILLPTDAEFAVPTGVPQPRDADAIADRELVAGVLAHRGDLPDHLVAGEHPRHVHRQVALGDVQIGAAHAARVHGDKEFTRSRLRHLDGDAVQRMGGHRARSSNPPRAHGWGGHPPMVLARPELCARYVFRCTNPTTHSRITAPRIAVSRGNDHPPAAVLNKNVSRNPAISAPTMPMTIFIRTPEPLPLTILPAIHPAIAPMTM